MSTNASRRSRRFVVPPRTAEADSGSPADGDRTVAYAHGVSPRLLGRNETEELRLTLDLIRQEFSYMDGVVDPPSSMHRLTVEALARGDGEVWVIGSPPIACVVMTQKPEVLYVGKLAVAAARRGEGLAKVLLDRADERARELGLGWVELQTRIELTANHQTFAALGFVETIRTAHPGYSRPTSITFRRPVPPS